MFNIKNYKNKDILFGLFIALVISILVASICNKVHNGSPKLKAFTSAGLELFTFCSITFVFIGFGFILFALYFKAIVYFLTPVKGE